MLASLRRIMSMVKKNKIYEDIIWVSIISIVTFIVCIRFEILQKLVKVPRMQYEIDQLITILIIIVVSLVYFSFQRWREIKALNMRLEVMSVVDNLTGVKNRRGFLMSAEKQFEMAESNAKPVALMVVNLNRFKLINTVLGHKAGDEVLKFVADLFQSQIRENDSICRIGGDEYLLMFPDTNRKSAKKIALRLMKELSHPLLLNNYEVAVDATIGISLYPSDGNNLEKIIQNADVAMNQAKKRNISYQFYNRELSKVITEKKILENDLRKALRDEEFFIYYQPQIDMNTKKITGVEALLRWRHPEKGLITPGEFIPLAEETGLIIPIGEWVLRKACEQNKSWQERGHSEIQISVNISALQLQKMDFVDTVSKVLKETGLDPKYLVLEIVESIAVSNCNENLRTLNKLKDLGVQISIDDFGTGYSSLSYLKYFPADHLKIDRAFVSNIYSGSKDEMIISTIITMAHFMKIKVVAEGVETVEELELLKARKCDVSQGYFTGRPVSPNEIERILSE